MESSDGNIEIDIDDDNTVALSTLAAVFGKEISGLGYKNKSTGNTRVVKCVDNKLFPPKCGWGDEVYFIVGDYHTGDVL